MVKNLTELIRHLHDYKGITSDSREVQKGYIFVALKGGTVDGHDFIQSAIAKGAGVIIGEKELAPAGADYIRVADSREALGQLASAWFGNPSTKLKVIGVTGTKGKTTTVHLVQYFLTKLGKKAGLVSSVSTSGFHVTTPDVVGLHRLLKDMVDQGKEYAVIEVSSHGIDQKRIAGVNFEVGVLTNIAPEHLDYHKTFKEYKRVKMSFINSCRLQVISPRDTQLDVLPGKFNNLDAEAALSVITILGLDRKKALETLPSFVLPEGRLSEISNNLGIRIIIDFAHTPDSLEAVLTYLNSQTTGKLISVFGCAGERDVKKRRKMGKISGKIADFSIFTSEDPRSENLTRIFAQMKKDAKNFVAIPERGEAIAHALSMARQGDTVGIFGKGHEKSMSFKGFEHPWSDFETVNNFLVRDKSISAIILAAGKGTRMKSAKPKILHEICGRPMIAYTLENLRQAKVGEIIAVTSYRKNLVIGKIGGAVKIAIQVNPKGGTADAVAAGLPKVSAEVENVMVLYGDDTAFYSSSTIEKVIKNHKENSAVLTFITLEKDNPFGLGRILRDGNGNLLGIVEEKDATETQRKIREVNDGLYIFDKVWLERNLSKVEKSPITGEYYIPELIKIAIGQKEKVTAYKLQSDSEWQGVNTPDELAKAEERMRLKLENYHG